MILIENKIAWEGEIDKRSDPQDRREVIDCTTYLWSDSTKQTNNGLLRSGLLSDIERQVRPVVITIIVLKSIGDRGVGYRADEEEERRRQFASSV